MDRLRALEVFVEVVKRDGFARAAEALDTSPANVTRYISDLEAHLQTRLLNRSSRKMSLTSSGEALFERAKSILDDVAEAEAIVSSAALQPHGVLRINAPLSFGILHLAPLWPKFMRLYPEVQLDVALIDREPVPLYRILEKNGYRYRTSPRDDYTYEIVISQAE